MTLLPIEPDFSATGRDKWVRRERSTGAWTLHDLRRTFATNLAALGVPVHVTEKALNHVSGVTGGIVAVYQRHTYEKEIREATELWERSIANLLETPALVSPTQPELIPL